MKKSLAALCLVLLITVPSLAQRGGGMRPGGQLSNGGAIVGKIIDATDNKPLEYTNVILYKLADDIMVTGTTSNPQGEFRLIGFEPGKYYIEAKYIGYEKTRIDSIIITEENRRVVLGEIKLERASYEIDGVEITGEKTPIEYKIDKKVINVDHQSTSLSGTAVDILENTPSVTVDIEGNVSLRGSTNFTVLIDGKPTVLEATEALEQLPASLIENIEIITNPSAKYDPDGTSGIINLVLKKNKVEGFSGVFNVNAGLHENYGGDFLINYKNTNYSFFVGADLNNRNFPGDSENRSYTIYDGNTSYLNSDGSRKMQRESYSFRGGFTYNLSDKDVVTLSGRYGGRDGGHYSDLNYSEWSDISLDILKYYSNSESTREGDFYSGTLDYSHNFGKTGHDFVLQLYYSNRDSDELDINELKNFNSEITESRKYLEGGPTDNLRIKAEYKWPINETDKLELGYQGRIEKSDEYNNSYIFDLTTSEYIFQPLYSHSSEYDENIHSLFGTYAGETNGFGYQIGLRGEYNYRNTELVGENASFNIDRIDLFPSLHFSYSLEKSTQFMASYSRRIDRPHGWFLEPFETWSDAYNVRRGNPGLDPEFIDSYELGFQQIFGWGSFSIEAYYRKTNNVIERIRSAYSENVLLTTFENVGTSNALGTELMFNFDPFQFWNVNLMGDLYNFEQEGQLFEQSFNTDSFTWSARFNNVFKLGTQTRLQLNGRFRGPHETSQGRHEGSVSIDAALRHEFIKNQLIATLQLRDIFDSSKHESYTQGASFYSFNSFTRDAPYISFTLSFRLNNYKAKRDGEGNGDDGMDMEGFD